MNRALVSGPSRPTRMTTRGPVKWEVALPEGQELPQKIETQCQSSYGEGCLGVAMPLNGRLPSEKREIFVWTYIRIIGNDDCTRLKERVSSFRHLIGWWAYLKYVRVTYYISTLEGLMWEGEGSVLRPILRTGVTSREKCLCPETYDPRFSGDEWTLHHYDTRLLPFDASHFSINLFWIRPF